MARNIEIKKLIKLVAREEGIQSSSVEEILDSVFLYQTTVMREADRKSLKFPSVRIPYWGIFHVPKWRVNKLKKEDDEII